MTPLRHRSTHSWKMFYFLRPSKCALGSKTPIWSNILQPLIRVLFWGEWGNGQMLLNFPSLRAYLRKLLLCSKAFSDEGWYLEREGGHLEHIFSFISVFFPFPFLWTRTLTLILNEGDTLNILWTIFWAVATPVPDSLSHPHPNDC